MTAGYEHLAEALPGYEIGDEIGRGAWGVVIAGRHRALGREVAIKQLALGLGADERMRGRFLGEARALARFDHPHIVRIFDFVEHDGEALLVMERLTGGTAFQRMRHEDPAPPTSCSWAVALCAGLQYAHEREVLHRDVKPENVMFSGDGTLRVTDFGIAKLMSATSPTKSGAVMGTPAYIAPEQAQGRPLTPATDLYAVGTVLYEMLAGKLPYDGADSALAALFQHVHEDHRPLLEAAPDVPPPVAAVVERSLARDPADRFESASEMGSELASAAEGAWGPLWERELESVLRSPIAGTPRPPPGGAATIRPGDAPAPPAPPAPTTPTELSSGTPDPAPPAPARRSRRRPAILAACAALAAAVVAAVLLLGGDDDGSEAAALPAAPAEWPSKLVIASDYGDVAVTQDNETLRETSGATAQGFTAGVDWRAYNADGQWVYNNALAATKAKVMPIFTLFSIGQAGAGAEIIDPVAAQQADLADRQTMERYWGDAREFLEQIQEGALGRPAVLVVEPTIWPNQELVDDRAAERVEVIVGSSGVSELGGLPDTLAGFAQGWVTLRDRVAPDVMLGYPTAEWGSGSKVAIADLPTRKVEASAERNAEFYESLGADFDLATLEVADYDSGYLATVRDDEGRATWTPDDYTRHTTWVREWVADAGVRIVLSQIPFGNTQMRAVDETRFHYSDNHVETLLGTEGLEVLTGYRDAGVIGLIFGTGRAGTTCPCDQARDGVTNPPAADGNAGRRSLSADDDGGYWREQTKRLEDGGGLGI